MTAAQGPGVAPRGKHVRSHYKAAQVRPAAYRPHAGAQVTQTAGVNPDPPAQREAAEEISPTVPYSGNSPTGYDPFTMGTF